MLVMTDSRHEPIVTLIHWLIFQKIPELLAQKTCNHSPFILVITLLLLLLLLLLFICYIKNCTQMRQRF